MARATWAAFRPSFGLTTDSLLMAGTFGLCVWVLFLAVWWGGAALMTRRGGGKPLQRRQPR